MNLFTEVDYSLQKVDTLLESFQDISAYDSIFFEGKKEKDDANAQAEANNQAAGEQSEGLLKKACNLIKKIFQGIMSTIRGILDYFTMGGKAKDGEERASFKEFEKMCKENPEFRNKKVTIHDYRQIHEQYEAAISQAEKEYKQMKETEESERPSFINDCKRKIDTIKMNAANVAKSTGSSMTVQAALDYAKKNQKAAQTVQLMVNYDLGLVAALERQIGSKQMKKAKRQLRMLNSRFKIIRMIAGWREEQIVSIKDSIKGTFSNIFSIAHIAQRATAKGSKGEVAGEATKKAVKGTVKLVGGGIKDGLVGSVADSLEARSRWKRTEKVHRKNGKELINDNIGDAFTGGENAARIRQEKLNKHVKDVYEKRNADLMDKNKELARRPSGKVENEDDKPLTKGQQRRARLRHKINSRKLDKRINKNVMDYDQSVIGVDINSDAHKQNMLSVKNGGRNKEAN